jgi:PDZ domain-containing protein
VIISPGNATELDRSVVSISGTATYPHSGSLLYLTVRVSNTDPVLFRYLLAELDDDVDVEKRQDVIGGCATYAESARINDELMTESQEVAKTLALRRLGYPVVETGTRAVILDVSCTGPSRGHLMLGDVVTAIDGTPVATAEQIRPLVQAHPPGDTIRLTVTRGGSSTIVPERVGAKDGMGFLGIVTRTMTSERYPFDVHIDTNGVSGPSAGLAFTLAIVDDLTPGDLTGGKRVAITGQINPDGSVTPVGGVAQKTIAARESGAKLMLVPAGEAATARAHADGMPIETIRTLDDALAALQRAGGAPVPSRVTAPAGQ